MIITTRTKNKTKQNKTKQTNKQKPHKIRINVDKINNKYKIPN
jgi:hypothetical protein